MIVVRKADMPSAIVETAFISNDSDIQKLIDPDMQAQVAKALADAIDKVLRESGITPSMGGASASALSLESQMETEAKPVNPSDE